MTSFIVLIPFTYFFFLMTVKLHLNMSGIELFCSSYNWWSSIVFFLWSIFGASLFLMVVHSGYKQLSSNMTESLPCKALFNASDLLKEMVTCSALTFLTSAVALLVLGYDDAPEPLLEVSTYHLVVIFYLSFNVLILSPLLSAFSFWFFHVFKPCYLIRLGLTVSFTGTTLLMTISLTLTLFDLLTAHTEDISLVPYILYFVITLASFSFLVRMWSNITKARCDDINKKCP